MGHGNLSGSGKDDRSTQTEHCSCAYRTLYSVSEESGYLERDIEAPGIYSAQCREYSPVEKKRPVQKAVKKRTSGPAWE